MGSEIEFDETTPEGGSADAQEARCFVAITYMFA